MAYTKTEWENRIVEFPNRYKDQNGNILTLTPDAGTVTKEGTKFTASVMNNIENGIYNNQKFSFTTTLSKENWVLNTTTNYYDYTITKEDITSNTYIDTAIDMINQERLGKSQGDTFDGYFIISTEEQPTEDIEITFIYGLTNQEIENNGGITS